MKHLVRTAAGFLVAVMVVAACGDRSTTSSDTDTDTGPRGTLTVGVASEMTSFDPADFEGGTANYQYLVPVYDSLLDVSDPAGIQPSLATAWSMEGLVVDLTLREGVTFSDGATFDAEVAKANIERVRDYPNTIEDLFQNVVDVTVISPTELTITLESPNVDFLKGLGGKDAMMVSPDAFDNPDLALNPVGSGPYVLDQSATTASATYTYTPRPNYWNPPTQRVEKMVLRQLSDQGARLNALQAGEIDVTTLDGIGADQARSAGFADVTTPSTFYTMVVLDLEGTLVEPLGRVKVRQALAYAIDREGFVEAITLGFGTPSSQPYGEGQFGYSAALDGAFDYDPTKAKQLLSEAGYPDGFEMKAASRAAYQDWITAYQGFFEKIGVSMPLTTLDQDQYLSVPNSREYGVFFLGFPQANPSTLGGGFWIEGGALNGFGVNNTQLAGLINAADNATTPDAQAEAAAEVTDWMVNNGGLVVAALATAVASYDDDAVSDVSWSAGLGTYVNILRITVN